MADKKTKITENIAKKSLFKKSKTPGSIFLELKNPKALAKLVIKKNSGGEMLKGKQKELDKNKDGKISGEDFKMMKARKGKMASDRDRRQKEITEKQNPISEYDKKGKLKYTAAKKGRLAEEDQYSKYVREIKEDRKPKGMKRLSDEVNKKSMGGESRGYGAARTSGMGLQDEELIPGKSLDYYKDVM